MLAAREKAAGKSREQIADLLVTEFTARGLDVPSATEIAVTVDLLDIGRQSFGKTRQKWRAHRLTGGALRDTVGAVRGRQVPNPGWMTPPEDASYPLKTGGRFVAVEVTAAGGAVLRRACAEASRHVGPHVFVELWLSEADPAGSGPVTVHLGENAIATLGPSAADELARDRKAAAVRAEKVRLRGRLYAPTPGALPIVEIGLPRGDTAP